MKKKKKRKDRWWESDRQTDNRQTDRKKEIENRVKSIYRGNAAIVSNKP